MSLPYFPMYPTDFEADTSHLTLEEDGAYNRLLRLMWMTPGCSLPDDDAWIMRRMRVDQTTFDRVVAVVLEEFFTRANGRVSNARLAREYTTSNEAHKRRVSAGSKGGKAKALKTNNSGSSNAVAKPKQPEPEPEPVKKKEPKGSSQKKGSRLDADWHLPLEWGQWAVAEGMDEVSVRREAEKFRDWWHSAPGAKGVKLDWLATWRNWIRKAIDDRKPRTPAQQKAGHVSSGAFGNIRERC